MPSKKSEASAKPKASSATGHSYQDMIKDAIIHLKDRQGSSRVALKKYVKVNNSINASDKMFDVLFNKALKAGVEKGEFSQPKGSSGGTKLAKKGPKPAAKPAVAKPTKSTAAAKPKKATSTLKKTTTKKAVTKKAVSKTKASAPKKETATKAKKPAAKKTVASAPAIVDKPTILGKTKSGRVTKTTSKTILPKKATPKKAVAKKTSTPKKTTATPAA